MEKRADIIFVNPPGFPGNGFSLGIAI